MIINDAVKKILNGDAGPNTGQWRVGMTTLIDYLVELLGSDSTDSSTLESHLRIGESGHRGLSGANDATSANTKFTVKSISTTYRNAAGGTRTLRTGATLTVDISLAGPVANGRDQAAVFSAGAMINIYKIYNGATEALIASLAAPSVGPALPNGYASVAYVGTIALDGSSNLRRMYIAGNRMIHQAPPLILSASPLATEQSVSYAPYVPTFAEDVALNCFGTVTMSTAGSVPHVIRLATNVNYDYATLVTENVGTGYAGYGRPVVVPNLPGQAVFNVWGGGANAVSSSIALLYFTVPNGAI